MRFYYIVKLSMGFLSDKWFMRAASNYSEVDVNTESNNKLMIDKRLG